MDLVRKFQQVIICIGDGFKCFLLVVIFSTTNVFASDATPSNKSSKAGYDNEEGFAGPASTVRQLEEDDEAKQPALRFPAFDNFFNPWVEQKKKLNEQYGLQIGIAYTGLYQEADDVLTDEDNAATGIFRLSGKWEFINRGKENKGSIVSSVDNRSSTSVAPAQLGSEFGYIGQTGTLFSNVDTILGDLYYSQYFNQGNTAIILGRYDPNDFFDVLGYANPWTTFQNLSIIHNASIALPDFSTGIGVGHWYDDQWYVSASASDANGVATNSDFEFDVDELYKTAEIGWSPSRDQRYLKNIHVTYWDVDERKKDAVDDANGFSLGANWTWDNTWMLFARAGLSDSDSPNDPQIYEESYTIGGIYYFSKRSDLLGFAVNWGELAAEGLGDQTTYELFYRYQLAQNLALTPSIQLIRDPALNNEENTVKVFGLRVRVTL